MLEVLKSEGNHVFQCPVSKLNFWELNGQVFGEFSQTRWKYHKPIVWGKTKNLENIINFQIGIYK